MNYFLRVCLSLNFCLTYGFQEGHLDVVKFLVEKGADVHHADNKEETPLWVASEVCFLKSSFYAFCIFFKKIQNAELMIIFFKKTKSLM